jgi:anti-anti-sigma regulatory factor
MQITVSTQQGRVPVTVMHLEGDLDASNYTDAIYKAQELYNDGARDLILDLGKVPYISSAGLMAVHSIALIFSGEQAVGREGERPSFRAVDMQRDRMARQHVKLLNPQPQVEKVLEMVGLKQFFQIFAGLQSAVNSF